MASLRLPHMLAAVFVAAAGLFLARVTGAPLEAAIAALVAGAASIALLVAFRSDGEAASAEAVAAAPELPLVPAAADLIEGTDEPVLLVRNRRVLLANAAARAVLGAHIVGVDVRLAIRHPAAAEQLTDRGPEEQTGRMVRTEIVGLGDPDRRWTMATSLLADGTRLVRLADRSEAHASEQMRTDFVANASHELRTPLATLLGYLETLQDEDAAGDEATRSRFLAIMFDEAQRMHRLVDDLISLSRIEAERFSLPREPVPLLPLVEEVRASCGRMAEEKGCEIRVEGDDAPVVWGDRAQLLQLLQNLVVNALKYGREGTPITIRFTEDGPDLTRMSVIDEGDGIAPEHLPRLTERFYRADPGRSRALGGTGLGLAIVKHIVGRHRGRLDIQSKRGEGTQVHVSLPKVV